MRVYSEPRFFIDMSLEEAERLKSYLEDTTHEDAAMEEFGRELFEGLDDYV